MYKKLFLEISLKIKHLSAFFTTPQVKTNSVTEKLYSLLARISNILEHEMIDLFTNQQRW